MNVANPNRVSASVSFESLSPFSLTTPLAPLTTTSTDTHPKNAPPQNFLSPTQKHQTTQKQAIDF